MCITTTSEDPILAPKRISDTMIVFSDAPIIILLIRGGLESEWASLVSAG